MTIERWFRKLRGGLSDAQSTFFKSPWVLKEVHELMEIEGLSPYCTSNSLAKLVNRWNNTIIGRLKSFGYQNIWLTWIQYNLSTKHNREKLQIVKLLLEISIVVDLSVWSAVIPWTLSFVLSFSGLPRSHLLLPNT